MSRDKQIKEDVRKENTGRESSHEKHGGYNQGVIVNSQGVYGNKYRLIVVTVCVLLAVAGILLVALL